MWVFPLLGTVVSLTFAVALGRRYVARRRPYHALWTLALLLYAGASLALTVGAAGSWSGAAYRWFWLLGAVLTVPYLAAGEVFLLVRRGPVRTAVVLLLVFATAFAANRVRVAGLDPAALEAELPRGTEVFAADAAVVTIARLYSYLGYAVLLAGTLWSAWTMRANAALHDRFVGTLAIALGATIVAAGSAFAAAGSLAGFSAMNTVGVAVMFWGFLRASRVPRPVTPASDPVAAPPR